MRFESVAQFADIHRAGTTHELELEARQVTEFNNGNHTFKAWVLCVGPNKDDDCESWIITVQTDPVVEAYLPKEGGRCSIKRVDPDRHEDEAVFWVADRMAMPFSNVANGNQSVEDHAMYGG